MVLETDFFGVFFFNHVLHFFKVIEFSIDLEDVGKVVIEGWCGRGVGHRVLGGFGGAEESMVNGNDLNQFVRICIMHA